MGTSKNRNKLNPAIPLIPDWIEINSDYPTSPNEVNNDENESNNNVNESTAELEVESNNEIPNNRFNQILREFKKGVKSSVLDRGLFTRVVKNYVSTAGGGSRILSQRMSRSSNAIIRFGEVLGRIANSSLEVEFTTLNLQNYIDSPVVDVLAALMDVVCENGAILDDAITKMAYANTIVRIDDETPDLNFNNLNQAQIAEMLAIFLEETIVHRVISDIGRSLTAATCNVEKALEIEEELYQIVNGLVHSTIVPLFSQAITSNRLSIEVANIYQIAFNNIQNQ